MAEEQQQLNLSLQMPQQQPQQQRMTAPSSDSASRRSDRAYSDRAYSDRAASDHQSLDPGIGDEEKLECKRCGKVYELVDVEKYQKHCQRCTDE